MWQGREPARSDRPIRYRQGLFAATFSEVHAPKSFREFDVDVEGIWNENHVRGAYE